MAEKSLDDALAAVAAGKPAPLYVLAGNAEFLVAEGARALSEALAHGVAHEVRRFEEGFDSIELETELRSLPMFAERVIVWVEGVGLLGGAPAPKALWRGVRKRLARGAEADVAAALGLLEELGDAVKLKLGALRKAGDPAGALAAAAGLSFDAADRADLALLLGSSVKGERPASPLAPLLAAARGSAGGPIVALVVAPGVALPAATAREIAAAAELVRFDITAKAAHEAWEPILAEVARTAGVRFTPGALAELARRLPPTDLRLLHAEASKLAAFAGEGAEIGAAAVAEIVHETTAAQGGPFELANAIRDRNTGAALAALRQRLAAGDAPQMLLGSIAADLRRSVLAAARSGGRGGNMSYDAWKTRVLPQLLEPLIPSGGPGGGTGGGPGGGDDDMLAKAHPFSLYLAWQGSGRAGNRGARSIPRLFETERALRGSGDAGAALERLVVELCK